jgi:hypothetical protein
MTVTGLSQLTSVLLIGEGVVTNALGKALRFPTCLIRLQ